MDFTIFVITNIMHSPMRRTVILSCCALLSLMLSAPELPAQVRPEVRAFQEMAGSRSVLYRGKQAPRYAFPANGHPYWESPEFRNGDIRFEGNAYADVPINIDAVQQLALVRLPASMSIISLSPALTPSFTIDGRQFIGVGPGSSLPEGFYEVFGKGPEQVYKRVVKTLGSSTNNMNGNAIGYYDENYRDDVFRYFAIHKTYYFRDREGRFSRFKTRRALLRRFPERKKEIRQAVKARQDGASALDFDTYCKTVLDTAAL